MLKTERQNFKKTLRYQNWVRAIIRIAEKKHYIVVIKKVSAWECWGGDFLPYPKFS
jgi:hypothetical protein